MLAFIEKLVLSRFLGRTKPRAGEFGVPKPFYFFLQKSYWFDIESTENERVLQGARQNNSGEQAG